jgi:hypothetical protein
MCAKLLFLQHFSNKILTRGLFIGGNQDFLAMADLG